MEINFHMYWAFVIGLSGCSLRYPGCSKYRLLLFGCTGWYGEDSVYHLRHASWSISRRRVYILYMRVSNKKPSTDYCAAALLPR